MYEPGRGVSLVPTIERSDKSDVCAADGGAASANADVGFTSAAVMEKHLLVNGCCCVLIL